LPAAWVAAHAPFVFVVSKEAAAAIRAIFNEHGELSTAIDNENARTFARSIASWTPLPVPALTRRRRNDRPGGVRQSGPRPRTCPGTGDRIEWMAIHIYTIRDGKVLENAIMRDELATMQRLGLVPSA
jgi:hypothetical protein